MYVSEAEQREGAENTSRRREQLQEKEKGNSSSSEERQGQGMRAFGTTFQNRGDTVTQALWMPKVSNPKDWGMKHQIMH